MASENKVITARGKWIISRALDKLCADPPAVQQLMVHDLCDSTVYRKTVSEMIIERMRQRGYKVKAPVEWDTDYKALMDSVARLRCSEIEQSVFDASLKKAKVSIANMSTASVKEGHASEEEWEDLDTSVASSKSFSSDGAERKSHLLNAKKSLKQLMLDSAKKVLHSSKVEQKDATTPLIRKAAASDSQIKKSERAPKALKRQASTVVASDAKKDKKTSGLEMDKTEFARSQNSRVKLVKERKELKDKERKDLIEAKLQQKQMSFKEKEKKASKDNKPPPAKVSAVTASTSTASKSTKAPNLPPMPTSHNGSISSKKASSSKPSAGAFVKPPLPTGKAQPPQRSLRSKNESPGFASMQNKARDGLRQGDLARQAIYHSILAAGDETRVMANSTFLPGVDGKPNFDASLALKGQAGETFVTDMAHPSATFVSKPGLVLSPAKKPLKKGAAFAASFANSFNETFRDYGIEDLCSDSDNTDDENQPSKPIPKWADVKSSRFKDRIKTQQKLGDSIQKYGLLAVYMPPFVDLEMIFEEKNKRFERHNSSSGMWNDTQDFIQH